MKVTRERMGRQHISKVLQEHLIPAIMKFFCEATTRKSSQGESPHERHPMMTFSNIRDIFTVKVFIFDICTTIGSNAHFPLQICMTELTTCSEGKLFCKFIRIEMTRCEQDVSATKINTWSYSTSQRRHYLEKK